MSWNVALAILITAPVVGKILDAAFHRLYNESMKEWIYAKAIRFDEWTYGKLAHDDAQVVLSFFARLFGTRAFSPQFAILVIVVLMPVPILSFAGGESIVTAAPWFESEPTLLGLIAYLTSYFILFGGFVLLITQLSLRVTRQILRRIEPSIFSLTKWLIVDIGVFLLLGPIAISATQFIFYLPVGIDLAFDLAILSLVVSYFSLIKLPSEAWMFSLTNYLYLAIWVCVSFPTIVHIVVIFKDLLDKALVRPLFKFLSGLFEYLAEQKQPLTWASGVIGVFPAMIKAWIDVGGS